MNEPWETLSKPGSDPIFAHFLRLASELEGKRLSSVIPKECYRPRVARGLLGFLVSSLLYVGAIVGIAFAPHWLCYAPLWLIAGLGGWGLHCIAHDCGHGSFSSSHRLNTAIGHLALLPLVYPFHAWHHVHNIHHSHTNDIELDTDWRPVSAKVYERLSLWNKVVYRGTRTWAFWGGTIRCWLISGFRPGFFPTKRMRMDVWRSIAFMVPVTLLYLGALATATGVSGVFAFFVMPWVATHTWFSATTLMHHSASDVPFLATQQWTRNASKLLVTTDYVYPRLLAFLTHNISIHAPHHVAPTVPFYHLPRAQAALKQAYPGMLRERQLGIGQL